VALFEKRSKTVHPLFREMTPSDVPAALDIVRRFSEDDYQVARHGLNRDVSNQFVLDVEGTVVGLTGVQYIDGTDNAYWLSWTYLREDQRGKGLGQMLLGGIFEMLDRMDARKVFLTTSDLRDTPEGPLLYGPAIKAYGRAGFEEEVQHAGFYTEDEGQIVMGRRIKPDLDPPGNPPEVRGCRITDVEEIVETDDAYLLDWSFASEQRAATTADIETEIEKLEALEARVAFVGVPSDAPAVIATFKATGFVDDGCLRDFYEDGVDEVRLRRDLIEA
jgi:GNAT superfamily N-acetyltransferase